MVRTNSTKKEPVRLFSASRAAYTTSPLFPTQSGGKKQEIPAMSVFTFSMMASEAF